MFKFTRPAYLAEDFLKNNFWGDVLDTQNCSGLPAVNIAESKDEFVIEVAAPGLAKDDFKINLERSVLTVSSVKESNSEEKDSQYSRREFCYNAFSRSFTLPNSIDAEKIAASYKEGILYISVPKKEEAKVKPAREIAIA